MQQPSNCSTIPTIMFSVKTNILSVYNGIQMNVMQIVSTGEVERGVATTMLGVVKKRIHEDGLASDGQPIGKYSEGYMRVRTGKFKTNGKYKSGPKKGQTKPTGVFTRGKKEGQPRPIYNRTDDTKVIGSLTRQMENDFKVVHTQSGNYGMGFTNEENFLKSQYLEKTYNKKIYNLTEQELIQSREVAKSLLQEQLKKF